MNMIKKLVCGVVCAAVALGATSVANADNVWTYYAAGADGNPTDAACVVHGEWIIKTNVSGTNPANGALWLELIVSAPADGILALRDVVLVDASGNRRAWMVHRASPYDKSGLAIFVR